MKLYLYKTVPVGISSLLVNSLEVLKVKCDWVVGQEAQPVQKDTT